MVIIHLCVEQARYSTKHMLVEIVKLDNGGEVPVVQRYAFLFAPRDMCLPRAFRQLRIDQRMNELVVFLPRNTDVGTPLQQAHGDGFAGVDQAMKQGRVYRLSGFQGRNIGMRVSALVQPNVDNIEVSAALA